MEDADETPPEPAPGMKRLTVTMEINLDEMDLWLAARSIETECTDTHFRYVQLRCLIDHVKRREIERPQMLEKACENIYHSSMCGKCRWCAMREVGG